MTSFKSRNIFQPVHFTLFMSAKKITSVLYQVNGKDEPFHSHPLMVSRPGTGLMRETLLNWLRFDLEGALILDAFAGSVF